MVPCELSYWGIGWSSLWGHETCEGCAELGVGDACGRRHWSLRLSSLGGHATCEGCAELGAATRAGFPAGAFGGAPYGAGVELPMGPRSL